MGKSLIIPGADFSANAIEKFTNEWYTPDVNFFELGISSDGYLVSLDWYYMTTWVNLLQGKTINRVKVRKNPSVTTAGYLKIGLFEPGGSTPLTERSILINTEGYIEYYFDNLIIPEGKLIAVTTMGDTGIERCRAAMQYTSNSLPAGLDYGHSIQLPNTDFAHTAFEIQFGRR